MQGLFLYYPISGDYAYGNWMAAQGIGIHSEAGWRTGRKWLVGVDWRGGVWRGEYGACGENMGLNRGLLADFQP